MQIIHTILKYIDVADNQFILTTATVETNGPTKHRKGPTCYNFLKDRSYLSGGFGASEKLYRYIYTSTAFHGNSRQVPWLHCCLYRQITGWELCNMSYSFSTRHCNFHDIARFITEVWAIIKTLDKLTIISILTFVSTSLYCMKLEHPLIGMVWLCQ